MSWQDVKHEQRKCKRCGKIYYPTSNRNLYCSRRCQQDQLVENARIERHRKANKKSNSEKIDNFAAEAKAHGLSYGQYEGLKYLKGIRHERIKTG